MQTRLLAKWPDGSLKWVLVDFLRSDQSSSFDLTWSASPPIPAPAGIRIEQVEGRVAIDTGVARFESAPVPDFRSDPCDDSRRRCAGCRAHAPGRGRRNRSVEPLGLTLGRSKRAGRCGWSCECLVRWSTTAGSSLMSRRVLRLHFFAGLPTVRVALTSESQKGTAPRWDMGTRRSRRGPLQRRVVHRQLIGRRAHGRPIFSQPAFPIRPCRGPFELYQDSSGGDNWQSPVHVNAEGRVPNRFRGYRVDATGLPRRACDRRRR